MVFWGNFEILCLSDDIAVLHSLTQNFYLEKLVALDLLRLSVDFSENNLFLLSFLVKRVWILR